MQNYLSNEFKKNIAQRDGIIICRGLPGSGLTELALSICKEDAACLYFSFAGLESSLALRIFAEQKPDIFQSCTSWEAFFAQIKERSLTVFFDGVGFKDDKDAFYSAVNACTDCRCKIVLLCRPWDKIGVEGHACALPRVSIPMLKDFLKLKEDDAAKLYFMTGGRWGLLAYYDAQLSFQDNLKAFLNVHSPYCRLAKDWMTECFRTPVSYNTLLYAMANGYNRVSEIAAFAGFPKNKCDKYLKALSQHGLIRKEKAANGYYKYYPASSYLALWCGVLLPAVPDVSGAFGEDVANRFLRYLNENILPDFYRELCRQWLRENINDNSRLHIDTSNAAYWNVAKNGFTFDFCYEDSEPFIYVYFDTVPSSKVLTAELWNEIERATTKDRPFYRNEYYVFTSSRVPDSYRKLAQQLDNIHLVPTRALFAEYCKDYNRAMHPRFVPSFVRRR